MSERQDPFYTVYNPAAGATQSHVQPQPAPHVSFVSQLNEQSLQAIRLIVREELMLAIRDVSEGIQQAVARTEADEHRISDNVDIRERGIICR